MKSIIKQLLFLTSAVAATMPPNDGKFYYVDFNSE